jgi:tRNA(Arg) A34 adenosine deaminase TadA
VIGEGTNEVTSRNDPTAHAEMTAIRAACMRLGSFSLAGCDLYANCEPCPMCLAAIYWARLDRIFYANTQADAARIGFDDARFYDELALPTPSRAVPAQRLEVPHALDAFEAWAASDATRY